MPTLPRYPIYVPTKGRSASPFTMNFLAKDGVPFYCVVEPQEADVYAKAIGSTDRLLVLPWSGDDATRRAFCAERGIENGGLIAVRNWIKEHSIAAGAARHWQLDDNMRGMRRWVHGQRIPCQAGIAMAVTEDFVDRYTNVAIGGLNYTMFGQKTSTSGPQTNPFFLNCHVYSCSLINNAIPQRWRFAYNDDTDLCLQVLSAGWCTVAMNAFLVDKIQTMVVKGGNTADLYGGDGRLRMARTLERAWPGVVETKRRFKRPQHVIVGAWRRFDTKLIRRTDIDWDALAAGGPNELGMRVVQAKPVVKSALLRAMISEPALPSENAK